MCECKYEHEHVNVNEHQANVNANAKANMRTCECEHANANANANANAKPTTSSRTVIVACDLIYGRRALPPEVMPVNAPRGRYRYGGDPLARHFFPSSDLDPSASTGNQKRLGKQR